MSANEFAADYRQQRASASYRGAEGAAIPPHASPPETRPVESPGSTGPFVPWTEEETDKLRHALAGDVTASQAAETLSKELHRPVTKNVVIGKCYRLGIALPWARGPRKPPFKPTPNPFPADVRGCLWPIGHPDDPQFHFCGQKRRVPDKPYCPVHAAAAYVRRGDQLAATQAAQE